jgi:hypothetical protein
MVGHLTAGLCAIASFGLRAASTQAPLSRLVATNPDCGLGPGAGGRAVSRERLADLLWLHQGSEQARDGLRNCLLELRKALGANAVRYLVSDFAHCRLCGGRSRPLRAAGRAVICRAPTRPHRSGDRAAHKSLVRNPSYGCAHSF